MATSSTGKAKVSISLDKEQLQMFQDFAKSRGMTFSGFVSVACSTFMGQLKSFDMMNDLALIMQRVKDTGKLSEEDRKLLDALEVAKSYTPSILV